MCTSWMRATVSLAEPILIARHTGLMSDALVLSNSGTQSVS